MRRKYDHRQIELYKGKAYSLDYIKSQENCVMVRRPGGCTSRLDRSLNKWRMRIQLDEQGIWFLSVFVKTNGIFEKYSLDRELAEDSHYEFFDERSIREKLYLPGDENRYFADILIRYVAKHSGEQLLNIIYPYITAQFHFD